MFNKLLIKLIIINANPFDNFAYSTTHFITNQMRSKFNS